MSLSVFEFQAEARTEFLDAVDYYSAIRPTLAEQFVAAVEHATVKIGLFPQSGSVAAADTRKMMVKKFPFNVVYQIGRSKIVVVAIAHHVGSPLQKHRWVARRKCWTHWQNRWPATPIALPFQTSG